MAQIIRPQKTTLITIDSNNVNDCVDNIVPSIGLSFFSASNIQKIWRIYK